MLYMQVFPYTLIILSIDVFLKVSKIVWTLRNMYNYIDTCYKDLCKYHILPLKPNSFKKSQDHTHLSVFHSLSQAVYKGPSYFSFFNFQSVTVWNLLRIFKNDF